MGWATNRVGDVPCLLNVLSHTELRERGQLAGAIDKEINLWTLQTFKTHLLHITVQPASNGKQIYSDECQPVNIDKYTIDVFNGEAEDVQAKRSDVGRIKIRRQAEWLTVGEYMERLPLPDDANWFTSLDRLSEDHKQYLWDQQWQWWLARSRALKAFFPFSRLPPELRELIYIFTYDKQIHSHPSRHRYGAPTAAATRARNPNTALLRLNRLAHGEASHILFTRATFQVNTRTSLRQVTKSTPLSARITNLHLAFSHEDFLHLFRFPGNSDFNTMPAATAVAVRHMPSLKSLTLDLQAPSPTTISTPFGWNVAVACQDRVVKWILTSAIPHVGILPCVQVKGHAKIKMVEEFQGKCAEERKKYLEFCEIEPESAAVKTYDEWAEDDGGVTLNTKGNRDSMQRLRVEDVGNDEQLDFPPDCHCQVSCALDTWSRE